MENNHEWHVSAVVKWDKETAEEYYAKNFEEINIGDKNLTNLYYIDNCNVDRFNPSKTIVAAPSHDHWQVYYCPNDLAKAWGYTPSDSELWDIFAHYLWDKPIYGFCKVNGQEFVYDRYMYNYERAEWIESIANATGCPLDILESVIPQEPSV